MSPIVQALVAGYSIPQILQFVSKVFPGMNTRVKQATNAGYSAEQILKFLSKSMEGGKFDRRLSQAEHHRRFEEKEADFAKNIAKTGVGIAGSALAGYLSRNALQNILPNVLGGTQTPTQTPPNTPQPPIGQQPAGQIMQPPLPQQPITQQAVAQIPNPGQQVQQVAQAPVKNIIPAQQIINQMGFNKHIQTLQKRGNNPEQIAAALSFQMTPRQKKWLAGQTQEPFQNIVERYLQEESQNSHEIPTDSHQEEKKNVILPNGDSAQIEGRENGLITVNQNGIQKKFREGELIESPISEKDLADLHEELIQEIQKTTGKEVSKHVSYAGYDPEANSLAYWPHTGELYVYENIPESYVDHLKSILQQRRTSGQNYIGAWEKDTESPIGSQMHDLIHRLKSERGAKTAHAFKFNTVYDYLEPAKKASRERYERKRKAKKKK